LLPTDIAQGAAMAMDFNDDCRLVELFAVVEKTPDMEEAISKLRDRLDVDHVVYHTSKLGKSPSIDPYIRLTYPASWIKRYLQKGYIDIDPVVREGFRRTLPFSWDSLVIQTKREMAFLQDALAHGVGPYGFSVPVLSKRGHRALFSISSSRSELEWLAFLSANQSLLIQIANRLHRRVTTEVFGEDQLRLTKREVECLKWIALGKDSREVAIVLNISPHTVRDYLKSARYKLECATLAQAVAKATNFGLLVP
jgi:LuxR family transcriptional regulator, quorum-sensing system regulator CinR